MRKALVLFAVSLIFAVIAHAQTISPVVVECGAKKCSGSFTVTNNAVQPLTVTVQGFSTTLDAEGKSVFTPLETTAADLELSETSARVSPKAGHVFDYSLRCLKAPCMVTLVASMTVGKTADGLLVRVALPHTIYSCEKQKGCRAAVRASYGLQ